MRSFTCHIPYSYPSLSVQITGINWLIFLLEPAEKSHPVRSKVVCCSMISNNHCCRGVPKPLCEPGPVLRSFTCHIPHPYPSLSVQITGINWLFFCQTQPRRHTRYYRNVCCSMISDDHCFGGVPKPLYGQGLVWRSFTCHIPYSYPSLSVQITGIN